MKESKIVNKRQGTRDFANQKQAQQSHKDVVHAVGVTDQKIGEDVGKRGTEREEFRHYEFHDLGIVYLYFLLCPD